MNTDNALKPAVIILITAIFVGCGCLKRQEMVQIRPDGSVRFELEFEGKEKELAGPDALPAAADGWDVKRFVRNKGDDQKHVLTATADFAPGQPLPASYGRPEGVYLAFPTTVQREQREDGVYITFRRVYSPRRHALLQYWHNRFIDDDIKKIGDKPTESLTKDERTRLLRAFANVESHQQAEIAKLAVNAALPNVATAAWLGSRRAMLSVYDEFDIEGLAESLHGLSESEIDKRVVDIAERLPRDAEAAMIRTLQERARLSDASVEDLKQALEREKLRKRVTESTRTHGFRIELEMPGEIVGHNGDTVENGRVIWQFNGPAFCDRAFELTAMSRIAASN